jgi:hypothetical protein
VAGLKHALKTAQASTVSDQMTLLKMLKGFAYSEVS